MSTLKIGWGRREISLDEPMSLPGQHYMRISEGVLDPMYVTALCLEKDGQCVVFMSCDMLSPMGMEGVCELVQQKHPDFRAEWILPNGTHAHTGGARKETPERTPDGKDIYPGEKYKEFTLRMGAEAVCEAWETRAPGGVSYGYGFAVVGHSRRTVYFDDISKRSSSKLIGSAPDGHGKMYGKTNDPQFSHYEVGADHFVNALYTYDAAGALTGILVNVPCPSQVSENFAMQTADYWNEVRQGIRETFGENVYVLPQCAAAGDTSPRQLHYLKAQQRRHLLKYGADYADEPDPYRKKFVKAMAERRDIAERIVQAVKEIYGWSKKEIFTDPVLKHKMELVPIHKRFVTDEEAQMCRDILQKLEELVPDRESMTDKEYRKAMSRYQASVSRNSNALKRYDGQAEEDPYLHTVVHVVQVGEVAFASNRFEMYQDYMHRIQARSPFTQTFVVQLASFEGGRYLPTQRGVRNKGYSASLFCNVVGFEGGQELVDGTLRMLEELKAQ